MRTRIQRPEYRIQKVKKCGQYTIGGTIAVETGQRWAGRWVGRRKSGQEAEKRTGFAHMEFASTRLGPDKSTQVVDFPHLAHASQAELGTSVGNGVREYRRIGGSGVGRVGAHGVHALPCVVDAKLCEKIIGFYRIVWLPKPATRWVPSRVVRLRETWSHFIGYYRTEQACNYVFSRILSIRVFFRKGSQKKKKAGTEKRGENVERPEFRDRHRCSEGRKMRSRHLPVDSCGRFGRF